ncbi:MAG TPA: hypothetical protein VL689_06350 [Paraburkholderia sp.]|nr:hypothetical protein [Paraburkholderia sp.]
MTTMTLRAVGFDEKTVAVPLAQFAHVGGGLRRLAGFAITASGLALIAVHGVQQIVGG